MNVDRIKSVWIEKYRPKDLNDLACNNNIKQFIQDAINNQDIPNILLYGEPGNGKNSITNILINNIDCTYLTINASSDNGIDTIRDDVETFANTTSIDRNLKIVILNEMDGISIQSQMALKEVMENSLDNCRFIITTNNKNKLNSALISRCVEFNTDKIPAIEIAKRLVYILDNENVSFENEYITKIIKIYGSNLRKIINESYKFYKMYGDLKAEYIENKLDDETIKFFEYILSTNDIKKINSKIKEQIFDDNIYTMFKEYLIDKYNSPNIVPIIMDYLYKDRIVSDHSLCFMSCLIDCKTILSNDTKVF